VGVRRQRRSVSREEYIEACVGVVVWEQKGRCDRTHIDRDDVRHLRELHSRRDITTATMMYSM
jgi:hypothetical protein